MDQAQAQVRRRSLHMRQAEHPRHGSRRRSRKALLALVQGGGIVLLMGVAVARSVGRALAHQRRSHVRH